MFLAMIILSVAAIGWADANCGPCPEIPKHYEELGCKGIYAKDGGCCPERFECPDFTKYNKTKCQYKGRSYDSGEALQEETGPSCSASCSCRSYSGETASFNCANIECPDLFNRPEPGCVLQYSLDKCCSVSEVCKPEEVAKLHKCHYRGTDYVLGERIWPENAPCYKCICDTEFDNTTSIPANKHCQKVDCGIELRNLDRIMKGCVPVYFGDNGCCPIEFRCPAESDEVQPLEGRADIVDDPDMVCKYNNLTLLRGEKLNNADKCVECTCVNPPIVDCKRKPRC